MSDPKEDGFILVGDFVLTFDREDLTEEFKELAARELRETPEVRDAAVARLKELVKGEEELNVPQHRNDVYLLYLRACKFYPDEAFQLMKRYFTFKQNNPKLCRQLLPSKDKNAFLANIMQVLPKRDKHGRRVMVVHCGGRWDPSLCSVYDFVRGVIILVKASVFEPKTQVAGGAVILDLEGMGLTQAIQVSPRLARTLLHLIQECMPLRLKAIHLVNQPYIFNMVYAIFKPFLDEKLRSRLHFHGEERESLLEDFGAKYLPTKYGGDMDLPDVPGSAIQQLFCHLEDEYEIISTYGYNTMRPYLKVEDDTGMID